MESRIYTFVASIVFIIFCLSPTSGIAQCNVEISAEVVQCNDINNTFNALITVTGTGTGPTFVLGGNGITYGSFSYNASPIEIGPFNNDGTIHTFAAIDNTTITCFAETEILPYDECEIECVIDITDVEFLLCDGLARYANVYIEHSTNVGNTFTLLINQTMVGIFDYGQDFYTIGPITGDCETGIGINVIDDFHSGCVDFYWQPGPWCCPDECVINDVIVNTYCVDDEIAGIIVDFNYNGNSNEKFEIILDSVAVDTSWVYEFPDTFFYNFIGPSPDTIFQGFGVAHVAKPNCGFYDDYILTCEDTPPCGFSNIVLSPIACDGDGTYSLGLDFQVESATSNFFDVYGAGMYLGAYLYSDLPLVINNFPERDTEYDIITINDNGNVTCSETIEFMGIDCQEPPCSFSNYFIEAHECDDDGLFNMYIQFDVEGEGDQGFIIRGNGIIYDTFDYGQDWYTFGPLEGDCETLYEFIIIDLAFPDCQIDGGFQDPICCEEACAFSDLIFEDIACDGELMSFFYDFNYTGVTNNFYDIFIDGQFFGAAEFSDLPLSNNIAVPANDIGLYEVTICENDNPACCISNTFQGPICGGSECMISEFFIEAHECNDDGAFLVDLEFTVSNPSSSSFSVFGDGNNYGTFEYGELFYTVGPFQGDCQSVYEFIVVDNDDQDCVSNYLFLGPICCNIEECTISDLTVSNIECDGPDNYYISVDFNHSGATNDFFDVIVNNEVIAFHALSELPVEILYPASGSENDVLMICINDNPDCCEIAEFPALDCNMQIGDCVIEEVFAEAYECDDDGFFLVDVAFNSMDGSLQGFEIRGNGVSYGTFNYGDSFYTIGPIEGDCETIFEFIIIDLEDETCTNFYGFDEPICCEDDGSCSISEVFAEAYECDDNGFFLVDIEFNEINGSADGFEIRGNGNSYGFFEYGQVFYTIGPIEGDCETIYEFVIIDQADENCNSEFVFEEPICCEDAECNISNLEAAIISCDSVNQVFFVSISFDVNDLATQFFSVTGNGQEYGLFGYGQDSYTLGPFEANGSTNYEFIVTDLEFEDCSAFVEFGTVDCMTLGLEDQLFSPKVSAWFSNEMIIIKNPDLLEISQLKIFSLDGKYISGTQSPSTIPMIQIDPNTELNGIYIISMVVDHKIFALKIPIFR